MQKIETKTRDEFTERLAFVLIYLNAQKEGKLIYVCAGVLTISILSIKLLLTV